MGKRTLLFRCCIFRIEEVMLFGNDEWCITFWNLMIYRFMLSFWGRNNCPLFRMTLERCLISDSYLRKQLVVEENDKLTHDDIKKINYIEQTLFKKVIVATTSSMSLKNQTLKKTKRLYLAPTPTGGEATGGIEGDRGDSDGRAWWRRLWREMIVNWSSQPSFSTPDPVRQHLL